MGLRELWENIHPLVTFHRAGNTYTVVVLKALKCANRFYKNLGKISAKNPRKTIRKNQLYFIVYRSREGEVELWMQDVVVQERLGGRVFNLARSYLYR